MNYKEYKISPYTIQEFPSLTSTNQQANSYPYIETKDRTVILTYCQTAGRGQVGNKWECEANQNFTFSIFYKPERLKAMDQFNLSMVVALGCRRFIGRYCDDCTIKWPNDIYVGDQKIAGILIEHTIMGDCVAQTIAGIGININQKEFKSDAPNPIALTHITGQNYNLEELLIQLIADIEYHYLQLNNYDLLKKLFMENLYRRTGYYRWQDNRETFTASIVTVDAFGRLVLELEDRSERIYGFKEVSYLR